MSTGTKLHRRVDTYERKGFVYHPKSLRFHCNASPMARPACSLRDTRSYILFDRIIAIDVWSENNERHRVLVVQSLHNCLRFLLNNHVYILLRE